MAKFEPMSDADEKRIIAAIDDADGYMSEGDDPSTAIAKSARDHRLTSEFAQLVVHAHNVAATTHKRLTGDDIFDKTADAPLADFTVVERIMQAATKPVAKAAVDELDYLLPPRWHTDPKAKPMAKVAYEAKPKPEPTTYVEARRELEHRNRAIVEARREAGVAETRLCEKMASLAKTLAAHRAPAFVDVRANAVAAFGKEAGELLDLVAERAPAIRNRKSEGKWTKAALNEGPYTDIAAALELAKDAGARDRHRQALAEATMDYADKVVRPIVSKPTLLDGLVDRSRDFDKYAGLAGIDILGSFSKHLNDRIGQKTPTPYPEYGAMSKLLDPQHTGELDRARNRAMLAELLQDEVLSQANPHEVAKAYSSLATMAPYAMRNPETARKALQTRMQQGATDLFEQSQLQQLDDNFARRQEPINKLLLAGGSPVATGGK